MGSDVPPSESTLAVADPQLAIDAPLANKLAKFLEREERAPLDQIRQTLKNIYERQSEHEQKDDERHREILAHYESQNYRVRQLEADMERTTSRIDRLHDRADRLSDTGTHIIKDVMEAQPAIIKAARGAPTSHPPSSGFWRHLREIATHKVAQSLFLIVAALLGWLGHFLLNSASAHQTSVGGGAAGTRDGVELRSK